MSKLYAPILVSLVGDTNRGPRFKEVIQLIGEPSRCEDGESFIHYSFASAGLMFTYVTRFDCFVLVSFHFGTRVIRDGTFTPYNHDLPFAISPQDGIDEIIRKVGCAPEPSYFDESDMEIEENPEVIERFCLPPYKYSVYLPSVSGPLRMFAVDLIIS